MGSAYRRRRRTRRPELTPDANGFARMSNASSIRSSPSVDQQNLRRTLDGECRALEPHSQCRKGLSVCVEARRSDSENHGIVGSRGGHASLATSKYADLLCGSEG